VGALTIGILRTARYFDPIKTANLFGRIARSIGPMMREQKIGRANLTAAFPEKSPAEIGAILAGVWDNLGRVGAEFAHLDHIWEHDPARPEDNRIEIETRSYELFTQLRLDDKPALIFASHLANWELPALAAVAHGLDAAILYRRPNIASADRIIQDMRAVKMGTLIPAGRDAPLKLAEALKNGQHVGMLVDQYLTNGVEVTFFGRMTRANPMLARLLRQIECPIHGVRIIRLPGHRFRAELSEEVKPVRDAAGHAGGHVGDRGLDPRISRSVAVATPPLAVSDIRERTRRLLNIHTMSSSAEADDPVFRDISDQSPASFSVTNLETRSPGKAMSQPGQ
jgi:KDO2-lipid IV(A) lauroyltransferase